MMGLFTRNAGVVSLRSLPLRRFFDLQYASIEFCLQRGIGRMPSAPMRVLDYGAGFAPYHALFPSSYSIETLDAFVPARYRSWDEVTASYDLILCLEVLEHLEDPSLFFAGARRCLQESGEIWLSVPYSVRVHPCPDDWGRWTPQGFSRLLGSAGFEVVEFSMRGPFPSAIFAKIAYANFRLLFSWWFLLGLLLLPFTCIGLLVAHLVLPRAVAEDEDPLGFWVRARVRGRATPEVGVNA